MLPQKVWVDGRRVTIPALRYASNNFDYLIYRSCREITTCLEKWVGVPMDYGGRYVPALLMINYLQGPVWMHADQGQEVGAIRKVVRATRRAKQLIKGARRLQRVSGDAVAQGELVRALSLVRELPPPVSIWIKSAAAGSIDEWETLFGHIHTLFNQYLMERQGRGGHHRARMIAIILRVLFEVHTDFKIRVGVTERVPEGRYAKCLQEVLSCAGVPVDFYRYAREAQLLSSEDGQLEDVRNTLRKALLGEVETRN